MMPHDATTSCAEAIAAHFSAWFSTDRIAAEQAHTPEGDAVERVAKAMFLQAYADATDGGVASPDDPEWHEYESMARAALSAMPSGLLAEAVEAIRPFADCCDQISDDEDDEEWAKFRLLIKDYRRARAFLAKIGGGK
jgi:hypothetical protein